MISLCTFVKNEEYSLPNMLASVSGYISEIIIVDTGSTDKTLEHIKLMMDYKERTQDPIKMKLHHVPFTNFAEIRTYTSHLATKPWVLMLDADETLTNPGELYWIINNHKDGKGKDAYAFPRRRWLDLEMTKRTELEAYPDWQVRFYKNNKDFVWKRELHEYFHGTAVTHFAKSGPYPCIEHFHDVFKSPERLAERKKLYEELAVKAGVTVEGGHVL